jgi:hypothetical protein
MMPDLRFSATVTGAPPAEIIARMAADMANANAATEAEATRMLVGRYPLRTDYRLCRPGTGRRRHNERA